MVDEVVKVGPIRAISVGQPDIAHRNDPNAHPGQVDSHVELNDLDADSHTQYALADGSRGAFSQPGHTHDYADTSHVHADLAADSHTHSEVMEAVVHGASGTATRGSATVVYWRGTVEPANATNGDLWHRTDNNTLSVKLSGAFVQLGQGA